MATVRFRKTQDDESDILLEKTLERQSHIKSARRKASEIESSNVISAFCTELTGFKGIKVTEMSKVWVNTGNKLSLIDDKGKILLQQEFDQNIDDFEILSTGEVLVVSTPKRVIRKISFTTIANFGMFDITSPDIPLSISVTASGEVILTLCKHRGCKCILRRYHVFFRRYNAYGKCLLEKKLSNKGKTILRVTSAIAENKSDICVIGRKEASANFLAVFDKNLCFLFKYTGTGTGSGKRESTFNPDYLCIHPNGNVVLLDSSNNTVDIIDNKGHFLMHLLTDKDGFKSLRGISVDCEGRLWISQENGIIIIVETPLSF